MAEQQTELKWFAVRVIEDRPYVLKFLEIERVEVVRIADIPNLMFLHCDTKTILWLKSELWGHLLVYRKAGSNQPDPVPEWAIRTIRIMAPFHDEPVIYLAVDDPEFFTGKVRRVTGGIFAGCIGVVKRIKGERRLIVRVSERAAIATPYIPQEFLEDAEE